MAVLDVAAQMEAADPAVEVAGRWGCHLLSCHIVTLPSRVIKAVCHTELGQLEVLFISAESLTGSLAALPSEDCQAAEGI